MVPISGRRLRCSRGWRRMAKRSRVWGRFPTCPESLEQQGRSGTCPTRHMEDRKNKLARIRTMLAGIPFNSLLGIEISRAHADGVTLRCRIKKELTNSQGALHGGVTASLADAAVGVAIHHRFGGT